MDEVSILGVEMNRREFIKAAGLWSILLLIPYKLLEKPKMSYTSILNGKKGFGRASKVITGKNVKFFLNGKEIKMWPVDYEPSLYKPTFFETPIKILGNYEVTEII